MELLNPISITRALELFSPKALKASCQPSNLVGDCVYICGDYGGDLVLVDRADPSDVIRMPAVGVIVSKESDTTCTVQYTGEIEDIYTGLPVSKPIFVSSSGRLSTIPPLPAPGGYAFVQVMGTTLGSSKVLLVPNFAMTKRIG